MAKIFKHSEEKFMANYQLFASSSKQFTFTDEAMTTKATKSEVIEMFKQGVVVNYGGVNYVPISCTTTGNTVTIVILTVSGSTVTPVTLGSDADEDDEAAGEK